MSRHTISAWIAAVVLSTGLVGPGMAGSARAESYDRERPVGVDRAQSFRQQVSMRELQPARPSMDVSVNGRALGQDTLSEHTVGREFRNAAEVGRHLSTQTKMRVTSGGEASADGVAAINLPKGGSDAGTIPEMQLRMNQHRPATDEADAPRSQHEADILGSATTGHPMGRDTVTVGTVGAEFKNKADMMAHMNMQTKMRMSGGEAGPEGEAPQANSAGIRHGGDEKSAASNPATLSPTVRAKLCQEGACFAKPQSSADVEDKAK